jgi:DNA polymerase-1
MKRLLFDSESDGFVKDATKVHCIAAVDVDTGECFDWKPDEINQAVEALDKADVVIGHNIQRHDIPLMTKLLKWKPRSGVLVRDTMICARLIYPDVKAEDDERIRRGTMPAGRDYRGKHTIAAWGYRLGRHKGDYAAVKMAEALAKGIDEPEAITRYTWHTWSPEMHEYMIQDVATNRALWDYLAVDRYSQEAVELEHRIARVCDEMEKAGVPFDVKAAGNLHAELIQKKHEIEQALIAQFGSWYQPISPNPSKAEFTPKRNDAKLGYVAGQTCTKIKHVTFNPGSREHIARVLLKQGWKPEKFTDGGKPQINEEVVDSLVSRFPEMEGLSQYLMLDKRLSQLADGEQAWLKVVKDDGRIHGVTNPMGTATSRAAHYQPNLGQVPNMASPYGKECRSLFYAPPGWSVVGCDASGLELRGLAHYLHLLDGGEYAKVVLDGDVHWMHANVMGLVEGERDKHNKLHTIVREDGSKRFIYAYIYGCGDAKAGEIIFNCLAKAKRDGGEEGAKLYDKFCGSRPVGESTLKRIGKAVRNDFVTRIKGFDKLKQKLVMQVEKFGWLPGLDGRKVPARSEHSALNFLIQSAGSIICKRWIADSFEELCSTLKYDAEDPWKGDFVFCLWVHDEVQVWVRNGHEETVREVLLRNAKKAGDPYGFRVALEGGAKIGKTWADTH